MVGVQIRQTLVIAARQIEGAAHLKHRPLSSRRRRRCRSGRQPTWTCRRKPPRSIRRPPAEVSSSGPRRAPHGCDRRPPRPSPARSAGRGRRRRFQIGDGRVVDERAVGQLLGVELVVGGRGARIARLIGGGGAADAAWRSSAHATAAQASPRIPTGATASASTAKAAARTQATRILDIRPAKSSASHFLTRNHRGHDLDDQGQERDELKTSDPHLEKCRTARGWRASPTSPSP